VRHSLKPSLLLLALPLLLTLCVAAPSARAGIRPSFSLESCAWFATHVVVATEGEKIDGVLTVLESWKGDLTPGDAVSLPDLAAFNPEASRVVKRPFSNRDAEPRHVTGDRMILFLKEKPLANGDGGRAWEPAARGGVDVSVLWVEGD
jgi:hypothetical protein